MLLHHTVIDVSQDPIILTPWTLEVVHNVFVLEQLEHATMDCFIGMR